jgi:CheY-like chemotaxis protein
MTLAMDTVSTVPHDVPPRAMTRETPMLGCVLVVEDDPAIATVVEETLTAEGYEVVCTGAVGALRLARELHPDVILLDYVMPGMDGAEISRRLRADRATAAIPLILMSACPPAARPRIPVDAELPKPFDLEAMSTVVAQWKDTRSPHEQRLPP